MHWKKYVAEKYAISTDIINFFDSVELRLKSIFEKYDNIKAYNQLKVIKAMQDNNLSDSHFHATTGYGYDDRGREVLDKIYAQVFNAEDALVRHQITSGTQAIAMCLYGLLRPYDELLSITGKPYDTLEEVIGIRGENCGSLKELLVKYNQVELKNDGDFDYEAIKNAINSNTKVIMIQKSRGYSYRPSISVDKIKKVVDFVKSIKRDVIVLVDNCYGEFVEICEPTEAGADIAAGSLIKNPGGGLAPTGGYIAGKKEYIEKISYRLTSPGLGKKVGPTLGNNRFLIQGLFMAPHAVAESLKGASLCACVMEHLGFETSPKFNEDRFDIIQAIKFGNPDSVIAFCQGIQAASPVDSFVVPEPWDMPGYDSPVIMAAGAFIQGSSIELSADAPIKPPYIAYMQGGLIYEHIKLAMLLSVKKMLSKGGIRL